MTIILKCLPSRIIPFDLMSFKLSGFELPQYADTTNECEFSTAARIGHN